MFITVNPVIVKYQKKSSWGKGNLQLGERFCKFQAAKQTVVKQSPQPVDLRITCKIVLILFRHSRRILENAFFANCL